jgi:hypothetical protein
MFISVNGGRRETAKRSQGILDTNQQVAKGVSTYKKGLNKVVVPP